MRRKSDKNGQTKYKNTIDIGFGMKKFKQIQGTLMLREVNMKVKMYVLGLPKFEDDKIVFYKDELEEIYKAIGKCLDEHELLKGKPKEMGGWCVYCLDHKKLGVTESIRSKINYAKLGYYHHRAMVNFSLDLEKDSYMFKEIIKYIKKLICPERTIKKEKIKFPKLREIRKELVELSEDIIDFFVTKEINKLFCSGEVRKEGEIKFVYTYPLIVVENGARKHETIPFSEQTTTSCFEIAEPSKWPLPGKRHVMRISIPSTILYTQGELGKGLLRDIINAIYQYCLYEKKLDDIEKGSFENRLDESLLVKLWKHAIDTMGGKTADVYMGRIGYATLFIAFLALAVAFLSLFATIWSILS